MDPPPRLHRNRNELIPLPLHKFQPIPDLLGSPEVRGMTGSARSQAHHVRLSRQASDEVNEHITFTNAPKDHDVRPLVGVADERPCNLHPALPTCHPKELVPHPVTYYSKIHMYLF